MRNNTSILLLIVLSIPLISTLSFQNKAHSSSQNIPLIQQNKNGSTVPFPSLYAQSQSSEIRNATVGKIDKIKSNNKNEKYLGSWQKRQQKIYSGVLKNNNFDYIVLPVQEHRQHNDNISKLLASNKTAWCSM